MDQLVSRPAAVGKEDREFDRDFFWSLFECMQEGVFAVVERKITLANSALCELLGYSREQILGQHFLDLVGPDHRELVRQRAMQRLNGESPPDRYEIDLVCQNGQIIHVQIKVSTFTMKDGTSANVGSVRDITSEKDILRQLKNSEREFRRIVENLPDIFYRTNTQGLITLASPYAANVLGYELSEIIGRCMSEFYAKPSEREAVVNKIVAGEGQMVSVESCLRHRDGSPIWVATHACARYDEAGEFIGVEGVARNITERKIMEQRLRHMAIRDPLTQVFNRFGFDECLNAAINRARRNKSKIALLFFDLDKFKQINDSHGHDVGDRYLAAFAKRLEIGFRETDTVARLGGDEFVALLENIEDEEMIYSLLERCITALSDNFVSEQFSLPFLYSYGIAQYPKNGTTAESLLKCADQAMYLEKKQKSGV